MTIKKFTAIVFAMMITLSTTGCGLNEKPDESTVQTTTTTERYIATTQTARHIVDNDDNDEDFEGYSTTTADTEKRVLENPVPDEPDSDIIATTTTTYYTLPETEKSTSKTNKTSKTTKKSKATAETKFVKNKLHSPLDNEKLKKRKKYKVVSDTTYLNLRFGPSKKYAVQLKIPNGVNIFGTAKTKDNLNNNWIYVSYKGTSGWVMEKLLKDN